MMITGPTTAFEEELPMTAAPADHDVRNPLFVRLYHHVLRRGEGEEVIRSRRRLLAGLHGRVVEVGPGDGVNFALYPPTVREVLAVEPEPYMRAHAHSAARGAPVPVEVVAGDAEHLPVADASVDAVVCALVLCSVPDQARALTEVRRVLRPGGELRVFEHVVAENPLARGAQRFAQATFWPRAFGGCHPARDTRTVLDQEGFDVSELRRFTPRSGLEPPLPHVLGRATLRA